MRRGFHALPIVACLLSGAVTQAASESQSSDAQEAYKLLRSLPVGAEGYQLQDFALSKDAATFTLTGTVHMLPAVRGRVTGAVFLGRGTMTYNPPLAAERQMLRILTKGEAFNETFERAVFRFTDDTAERLKGASKGDAKPPANDAQDALKDVHTALRRDLKENLHARILQDVLGGGPGGLFHAYLSGKKYSDKLAYMIDPHGLSTVAPEEIQLLSWSDTRFGIFAAHHFSEFYQRRLRAPTDPAWIDVQHQRLDTEIEPSGELNGDATTTFAAMVDGLHVVPLQLYPTLRVSEVTDADGALAFIQEAKDEDADLWVVLRRPLRKGEKLTIRTLYKGKDAISAEGNDNFYPVARTNWYPHNGALKDYATYEMRFAVHKRMRLVATGDFVDEATEGEKYVSRWKADYPKSVAGFNLGSFRRDEGKVGDYTVVALANTSPSNGTSELLRLADKLNLTLGALSTQASNKAALSEARFAMQLFDDYFGPLSLKRVHVTQQTACNYGQAWPGVLYIPTCYYWTSTVRHQLGMQWAAGAYWDAVTSHEVAHLWWGHAVGWNSYRDQWMSEGFSNLAASLFLQAAYPKEPQRFRDFWRDMLRSLTEKNANGFRANDVGPLTLGYRLNTSRTGAVASSLLYPKGAYVLHMLRMMMWNRDEGDAKFKAMLRDFIATHNNRTVTTEDFQRVVEKHMLPDMNLDNDGTMNWFFRQFVYGMELPTYKLRHSLTKDSGQTVLNIAITQSGVSDGFRMRVPLYLELQDGRVIRLGSATLTGNKTLEQTIPVGQAPVKRVLLNYYYDVLSLEEK